MRTRVHRSGSMQNSPSSNPRDPGAWSRHPVDRHATQAYGPPRCEYGDGSWNSRAVRKRAARDPCGSGVTRNVIFGSIANATNRMALAASRPTRVATPVRAFARVRAPFPSLRLDAPLARLASEVGITCSNLPRKPSIERLGGSRATVSMAPSNSVPVEQVDKTVARSRRAARQGHSPPETARTRSPRWVASDRPVQGVHRRYTDLSYAR